jgi:hypothetical protein
MSKYRLYRLIALTAHFEHDFQYFVQAMHDLAQDTYRLRYHLDYHH